MAVVFLSYCWTFIALHSVCTLRINKIAFNGNVNVFLTIFCLAESNYGLFVLKCGLESITIV